MPKIAFTGDFEDLYTMWGIGGHNLTLSQREKLLSDYIWSNYNAVTGRQDPQIKSDIHDFLDAMISFDTEDKVMYEAMRKLEDDFLLTLWFASNIQNYIKD
jgi:hypothetical protein